MAAKTPGGAAVDVQRLREEIPVLGNVTYLNTGWSGPPPRRVAQALKDRVDLELYDGPTSPEVYEAGRAVQNLARLAAARLFNSAPDEVLVTRNTTEGLNIVLSGLDWRAGDEIITCSLEHSSVLLTSLATAQRHDLKVHVVELDPHDSRETILGKFESAFTTRTRMIFVSHVEYSTGLRMPAPELTRLAHDRGAHIMLDGAQTGGHLHLDVAAEGFDFYSIPGQKWLLGYEGVGALYIRRDLIERVHPAHSGGRAVVQPVDYDNAQLNSADMEKFHGGSSSVPLQAAFVEAVSFIEEVGASEIEVRNRQLAARLKEQLAGIPGVHIYSPTELGLSSGLVSFALTGWEPTVAVARLWDDHRIVVRQVEYPAGIRASLHFFNTENEVDQLARAVKKLV
jgi:L-cysteine/cystine lyase